MPAFREEAVCDEKLSEVTHAHLNLVCKRTGKQRPVAKTDFVGNVISLASDERKKHFLGETYNFDFHISHLFYNFGRYNDHAVSSFCHLINIKKDRTTYFLYLTTPCHKSLSNSMQELV